MNKTHQLSGKLTDANGSAVVGALVTVKPVPPFTVQIDADTSVNVAAPLSITTGTDGGWSLDLYPTPVTKLNYRYEIVFEKDGNVLLSKKFRMPGAPASLYAVDLNEAYVVSPIGSFGRADIPLPKIDHPTLSDIDVTSATGGDWGDWVEIYAHQNTLKDDVFDTITGELTFNPTWGTTNPYAEVEVRVLHTKSDKTTLVENVLPHLNTVFLSHLFSSPLTPHTESLSIAAANILAPNDYLIVSARIRRHGATGTAQIMGAQSSLYISTVEKQNVSYITTVDGGGIVSHDNTLTGDGTEDSLLKVTTPFTNTAHAKLDGIEAGATADQTWSDIVARARASTTKLPASTISGLPTSAAPTTLGGLTDVSASTPLDGQVLTWDAPASQYELKSIPAANIYYSRRYRSSDRRGSARQNEAQGRYSSARRSIPSSDRKLASVHVKGIAGDFV